MACRRKNKTKNNDEFVASFVRILGGWEDPKDRVIELPDVGEGRMLLA